MGRRLVDTLLLLVIVVGLGVAAFGGYQYLNRPKSLVVRWSTESELEILGFHIYRADCAATIDCDPSSAAYQQLTQQPIRAAADPVLAGEYEFIDAGLATGTYAYLVETLYLDGSAEIPETPLVLELP